MAKEIITQQASDNTYYHKDFHTALNYGIDYLHRNFGKEAVRQYLSQFAASYYFSLKEEIKKRGLPAIREHYERIFKIEDASFEMSCTQDLLNIRLSASPAVMHIKEKGHTVSDLFAETIATVNQAICEDTPYNCELISYSEDNGGYHLQFYRS